MGVSKVRSTLFFLMIWRLSSVFIVQTSHVPDEYWQSLEVAHKLTFGYGYLTWEWTTKIRSYIHPFLISIIYRLLHFMQIDYASILIYVPRLLQAILSAYADYRFYIWTKDKWSLFSLSTNWYWYYCATRTLTNSFETSLTIVALSIFPWRDRENSFRFLWIVGFLSMARPTSGIIWLPLCLYHFCTRFKSLSSLITNYFLIGATCLSISILIDSLCYGEFVITPWEFFKINVLEKVSESYGTENPFWYFSSGLPVILGIDYLTFFKSVWRIFKHWRQLHREAVLLVTIAWTIFCYSCLAHKEFRFILPLLPVLIYINNSNPHQKKRVTEFRRKLFIALYLLSNIIPGFYFSLIHQRGSLDTMKAIRNDLEKSIESLDKVCESLDELTLKNLELMEEKISVNIQMEECLREGHIELAKARYIRGKESIGRLQIPTEDETITTIFELQTTISEENEFPHFDISLKKSFDRKEDIPDPIKRFGVLVPQNLKNAQKQFQGSVYLATKAANLSAELLNVHNELQSLIKVKESLCENDPKIDE